MLHKGSDREAAVDFSGRWGISLRSDRGPLPWNFAESSFTRKSLQLVLSDIRLASFLEEHTNFTLFMLGGVLRNGFHYVNTTVRRCRGVSLDKLFLPATD